MAEEVAAALAAGLSHRDWSSARPDAVAAAMNAVFDDVRFLVAALDTVIVDNSSGAVNRKLPDEIVGRERRFCRVIVLQRPHRGLSAAGNAVLRAALADLVLLLEANDLAPKSFFDDTAGVFARRPARGAQNFTTSNYTLVLWRGGRASEPRYRQVPSRDGAVRETRGP